MKWRACISVSVSLLLISWRYVRVYQYQYHCLFANITSSPLWYLSGWSTRASILADWAHEVMCVYTIITLSGWSLALWPTGHMRWCVYSTVICKHHQQSPLFLEWVEWFIGMRLRLNVFMNTIVTFSPTHPPHTHTYPATHTLRSLIDDDDWRMSKAISLILFMLALIAVAMTNYSLSLYLSLALTLPAVLTQPRISGPGWAY